VPERGIVIHAMNASRAAVVLPAIAVALTAAVFFWFSGFGEKVPSSNAQLPPANPAPHEKSAPARDMPAAKEEDGGHFEKRVAALEETLKALQPRLDALEASLKTSQKAAAGAGADKNRLAALEGSVRSLQQAVSGVNLEKVSAERQALFAAEEGYLKADEYAAAGQHAIAGEGYLTFLQNHPDHADARDVMRKARDSFLKAGYNDKAFWVHEEMMKTFPENRALDLWDQAKLEKEAGLYDRAVAHAAEAAELAPNSEERLWRRLYWAWYVQLRDGAPSGIAALQQVQQEIAASGVKNPKLTEHATKRMQEWQQQARQR
jgi:TolA-binding protein